MGIASRPEDPGRFCVIDSEVWRKPVFYDLLRKEHKAAGKGMISHTRGVKSCRPPQINVAPDTARKSRENGKTWRNTSPTPKRHAGDWGQPTPGKPRSAWLYAARRDPRHLESNKNTEKCLISTFPCESALLNWYYNEYGPSWNRFGGACRCFRRHYYRISLLQDGQMEKEKND